MRALLLGALTACGAAPETVETSLRWRLARSSCQELGGARVVVEAGGLGELVHGPCEQTELIRLELPAGERTVRATLFDRAERAVATGTAPVGAVVVMQAEPGARGALWLWPHLGGVAGCEAVGIDRYYVTLTRPWGDEETRQIPCRQSGDLLLEHLWPGTWQIQVEARSVEGIVLGRQKSVRAVEPGARLPVGDEPSRLDLVSAQSPQGRVEVLFRRLDGSAVSCAEVGLSEVSLRARQHGLTRQVEFRRACDEELPEWRRVIASAGTVDLLVEGLQGDQILYSGAYTLRYVPTRVMPPLVLEQR